MLYTRSNNEVLGFIVLQHQPHTFNIVLGVAPVAKRREVAEIKLALLALCNACGSKSDLARHEGFATALTLVVEEDARATEHLICLAIFLYNPVPVELGYCIGAIGMEWCIFILWDLLDLTIKFRGRRLINVTRLSKPTEAYSLEYTEHTRSINIGSKLRRVKAHLHMALCSEIINLIRTYLADDLHKTQRVTKIGIVKMKIGVTFKVSDTFAKIH